jgi:hypothetical protein
VRRALEQELALALEQELALALEQMLALALEQAQALEQELAELELVQARPVRTLLWEWGGGGAETSEVTLALTSFLPSSPTLSRNGPGKSQWLCAATHQTS